MASNNSWEIASELAEKYATQNGIFIRLAANGAKAVGVFCGEPFTREVAWTGEKYEAFDPAVHTNKRPSLRVLLNFFVSANGMMKVIEGGTVWFKDVLKVRNKYGLDKWSFEIERHSEVGDPKTTYSILSEEKLDDDLRGQIAAMELHDLATVSAANEEDDEGAGIQNKPAPNKTVINSAAQRPVQTAAQEKLIDNATAVEIANALRQLARHDVELFFNDFGLKRVRDLKADQLEDARVVIQRMNAHRMPMRQIEELVVMSRRAPKYRPQKTPCTPRCERTRHIESAVWRAIRRPIQEHIVTDRYPSDLLRLAQGVTADKDRIHPTQKPLSLGRYMVRAYSDPGDVVLDFAAGSGTFPIAALEEGRNFIGVERNADVCAIKADSAMTDLCRAACREVRRVDEKRAEYRVDCIRFARGRPPRRLDRGVRGTEERGPS